MRTWTVRYEYAVKSGRGGLQTKALRFKVTAEDEVEASRIAEILGKSAADPWYDHHILTDLQLIQPCNY